MKKAVPAWAALILAVAFFTYLTFRSSPVPYPRETGDSEYLIGFSIHFLHDDYTVSAVAGFEDVMREAGYDTIVVSADGDSKKQVADIEDMIRRGVDAIGVCPLSEDAIRNSLIAAKQQGIRVVTITEIPGFEADAVIYGREYENGYGAGQELIKAFGENQDEYKVAVLDFPYDISRTKQRIEGFEAALEGTAIETAAFGRPATNEETMDYVKRLLTENPDIRGIFGSYSNQVIGAGALCKALGREDITVVGVDADTLVLKLIDEGWVQAVTAQFPRKHGEECAKAIIKLLAGETIEEPYREPYMLVNAENTEEAAELLWRT